MTARYKLQALFELREHAVAEAEQALAEAVAKAERLQAAQHALDDRVGLLLRKLAGQHPPAVGRLQTAAQWQAQSRFAAKLQVDVHEAEQLAQAHRAGDLLESQLQLVQAQAAHVQAKQDYELLKRHRDAALAEALRQEERLQDNEVDDWLRAQRPS